MADRGIFSVEGILPVRNVWRDGVIAALLTCCTSATVPAAARPTPEGLAAVKAPYRRPAEIPFPALIPYTPEKAALGKALYFDPRVSARPNMNCAPCPKTYS